MRSRGERGSVKRGRSWPVGAVLEAPARCRFRRCRIHGRQSVRKMDPPVGVHEGPLSWRIRNDCAETSYAQSTGACHDRASRSSPLSWPVLAPAPAGPHRARRRPAPDKGRVSLRLVGGRRRMMSPARPEPCAVEAQSHAFDLGGNLAAFQGCGRRQRKFFSQRLGQLLRSLPEAGRVPRSPSTPRHRRARTRCATDAPCLRAR